MRKLTLLFFVALITLASASCSSAPRSSECIVSEDGSTSGDCDRRAEEQAEKRAERGRIYRSNY